MINCQFENGDKVSLRHVTTVALIVKDNKILLGLRGKYKGKPVLESGKWCLIGGFLDRGENVKEGIHREVGWVIKVEKLIEIKSNPDRPKEDRQNVEFVFLAEPVKRSGKGDDENSILKWFELDKLPPKELMAFDHFETIELYKKNLVVSKNSNKNLKNKLDLFVY